MTNFLIGFAAASLLWASAAAFYYLRARRRVQSIQAAIRDYHKATRTVNAACDTIYANPNTKRIVPANRKVG